MGQFTHKQLNISSHSWYSRSRVGGNSVLCSFSPLIRHLNIHNSGHLRPGMKKLFKSNKKDKEKHDMSSESQGQAKISVGYPDMSIRTVDHSGHAHGHAHSEHSGSSGSAFVGDKEARIGLDMPDVTVQSDHRQASRIGADFEAAKVRNSLPVIKSGEKSASVEAGGAGIHSSHSSLHSGSGEKLRHASSESERFKVGLHSDSDSDKGIRVARGHGGSHPAVNVGFNADSAAAGNNPMQISIATRRRSGNEEGEDKHGVHHHHGHGTKLHTKVSSLSSPSLFDERPMSPTTRFLTLSRIDEKNSLVGLNDRLAKILARNRQLEAENANLNIQVKDADTKLTLISKQLTISFEEENAELRKLLEASDKDKEKLRLALGKFETDLDDALRKLRKKEDELAASAKQIVTLEYKLQTMAANAKKSDDDKAKLGKEKDDLTEENLRIQMELRKLREDFENECMNKVELENQIRNKGEELQMKVQVHQQQFAELMTSRKAELHDVGGKLKVEYDARLADAIRALRADCEMQIMANREEQGGLYMKREDALKGQLDRLKTSHDNQAGELSAIQLKMMALEKKITAIDGEKMLLLMSLKDAEAGWAADKAGFASMKAELEALIASMQEERQILINDYQGLMEIKVALDNEIATYRALLEGEEERLDTLLLNDGGMEYYDDHEIEQQIQTRQLDFDEANKFISNEKRRFESAIF